MWTFEEELYGKYADELLRFAATLVGPADADDVVASGVMRAFTSPSWEHVEHHRAYLYRTVLNEARQAVRRDQRRRAREQVVSRTAVSSRTTAPDDGVVASDVWQAMTRLSIDERAVVFLAYWVDLSVGDIAATLGMSPRTVERRLRSGRERLREELS